MGDRTRPTCSAMATWALLLAVLALVGGWGGAIGAQAAEQRTFASSGALARGPTHISSRKVCFYDNCVVNHLCAFVEKERAQLEALDQEFRSSNFRRAGQLRHMVHQALSEKLPEHAEEDEPSVWACTHAMEGPHAQWKYAAAVFHRALAAKSALQCRIVFKHLVSSFPRTVFPAYKALFGEEAPAVADEN